MERFKRSNRRGISLIEVLVVIGIIGVLVSLLLPAIQAAREAAARTQCQNNLRQLGLALQQYEGVHRSYPMARYPVAGQNGATSWFPGLLPYLEQTALHARYNFTESFDSSNNTSVAQSRLTLLRCPSSVGREYTQFANGTLVPTSSYHPVSAIHPQLIGWLASRGVLSEGKYKTAFYRDPSNGNMETVGSRSVRDGLSNSWMIIESDGAPDRWHLDHAHDDPFVPGGSAYDPLSAFVLHGITEEGTSPGPKVFLSNGGGGSDDFDKEPFGFHRQVINVLRGDGGVDSVSKDVALPIVIKRFAIDDGQLTD